MNITSSELDRFNNAATEEEWNAACDDIKAARGGQYPPDWYAVVIRGGVLARAQARFG
jgi:hypothetical protein